MASQALLGPMRLADAQQARHPPRAGQVQHFKCSGVRIVVDPNRIRKRLHVVVACLRPTVTGGRAAGRDTERLHDRPGCHARVVGVFAATRIIRWHGLARWGRRLTERHTRQEPRQAVRPHKNPKNCTKQCVHGGRMQAAQQPFQRAHGAQIPRTFRRRLRAAGARILVASRPNHQSSHFSLYWASETAK